jgi:hypothetical protein
MVMDTAMVTLIMVMDTDTLITAMDGAILIMATDTLITVMDTQVMVMAPLIRIIPVEEVLPMEAAIQPLLLIIGITPEEIAPTAETTFPALAETAIPITTEHPLLSPTETVTLPLDIHKEKAETITTKPEQTQTALPDKVTLQVQIIRTEITVPECLTAAVECLAVVAECPAEVVEPECLAVAEEDNIYLHQ